MMETIKFECEVITPMFLGGADGKSAELRAPSIKGALRFWWRAMNGHLSLKDLHEKEAEIFGGSGEKQGRSKVIVRGVSPSLHNGETELLLPHNNRGKSPAFLPNKNEKIIFNLSLMSLVIVEKNKNYIFDIEKLKSLFILTCTLGGLGRRSRRGFGSLKINQINNVKHSNLQTIDEVLTELQKATYTDLYKKGRDAKQREFIYSNYTSKEKYPYIKKIQIGRERNSILSYIGNQTSDFMKQDAIDRKFHYEASMGTTKSGRFASPIYISTIQKGNNILPIITTLNTCPPVGMRSQVSIQLQDDFKETIL
jgi:CRISPR-associated protein Cmr1